MAYHGEGPVQCVLCDEQVHPGNLSSHQKTKACKRGSANKLVQKSGYNRVSSWSELPRCRELCIDVKMVPGQKRGGRKTSDTAYAPAWAQLLLNLELPHSWRHVRKPYMEHVMGDQQLQKAVVAANRIGGNKAVRTMVFQRMVRRATFGVQQCSNSGESKLVQCGGFAPENEGWGE